jgi:hypothetical protein
MLLMFQKNKFVRSKVYDILDQILEIGRHTNTSLIITNHLATNGTDTKRAVNESHFVTFFPMTISSKLRLYLNFILIVSKLSLNYDLIHRNSV